MTQDDLNQLQTGDIIIHKSGYVRQSLVVTMNYGGRVTAVSTADITNASEWDIVSKAEQKRPNAEGSSYCPICRCHHQ